MKSVPATSNLQFRATRHEGMTTTWPTTPYTYWLASVWTDDGHLVWSSDVEYTNEFAAVSAAATQERSSKR